LNARDLGGGLDELEGRDERGVVEEGEGGGECAQEGELEERELGRAHAAAGGLVAHVGWGGSREERDEEVS